MDEKMVGIMEATLHKLEEISNKLEHIEDNTHQMEDEQAALKGALQQLSRSVRNDNIMG
ncbi:hypothetical protein P7G51_10030 [Enterococcus asini]|uniref:hypothetical protein n=1 Tax=Enterococcus TaxID=1350 RepID=UPI00288D40A6|nr:hypothetical protein [Enterococcus asini]MDT2757717.1 hypothetical protein [Enterococcus asini]